jgi:uncharacterized protein with HEPN domain
MIEAIRLINEKLPRTKDEFTGSDLLQIWVLYHIQIIGEAANGISSAFRSSHPSVPWQDIIAMRHLLIAILSPVSYLSGVQVQKEG